MEPVYTPVIGIVLSAFKAMKWDITVTGAEHIPRTGPAVLATNHVSYLDFTFVGYGARLAGKRLVRFMAKKEIFDNRYAGPLMRGMKHIPVDRGGRASKSLEDAKDALRRGEVVGMFPEATISRSFVPLPGKTGTARMAMETGVPIVPGAVWGTQRLWTKGRPRSFTRGIPVTVAFGPPVAYQGDEDPQDVTDRLMTAIGDLVDEAQRSYPDAPASHDDAWWQPAHLGGSAPTPEEAEELARAEAQRRRERRQQELGED